MEGGPYAGRPAVLHKGFSILREPPDTRPNFAGSCKQARGIRGQTAIAYYPAHLGGPGIAPAERGRNKIDTGATRLSPRYLQNAQPAAGGGRCNF